MSLAVSLITTASFLAWKRELSHMDASVLVMRGTFFSWIFGSLLIVAVSARPDGLVGRLGRGRLLRFLGKYSYGLYIFHYPLIPFLQHVYSIEGVGARTGSLFAARLGFVGLECAGLGGPGAAELEPDGKALFEAQGRAHPARRRACGGDARLDARS